MSAGFPRTSHDIVAKHLMNTCAGSVLNVVGIRDTDTVRVWPTDITVVDVHEAPTDVVLEQRDGSLLHIEVQTRREMDLWRFFHYDTTILYQHRKPLRSVVLYTRHVNPPPLVQDWQCISYRLETVVLADRDGEAALARVADHLAHGQYTQDDRMVLAFAYGMGYPQGSRPRVFQRILELIQQTSEAEKTQLVALILGLSGKLFTVAEQQQLEEVLHMSEMLQWIEQRYKAQGMEEGRIEGRQEGRQEGRREGRQEGELHAKHAIARQLLAAGDPVEKVMRVTELTRSEVEALRPS